MTDFSNTRVFAPRRLPEDSASTISMTTAHGRREIVCGIKFFVFNCGDFAIICVALQLLFSACFTTKAINSLFSMVYECENILKHFLTFKVEMVI